MGQLILLCCSVLLVSQCGGIRLNPTKGEVQWPASLDFSSRVQLNDGKMMYVAGFGTYRIIPGRNTYEAVTSALEVGYRLIDTAEIYGNEASVGRAVRDFMKKTGTDRSEIFITTKVFNFHHGKHQAIVAGQASNQRLDLGYIDLLLIHSPLGGLLVETYDGLLELQRMGVVRSVGVSNFGPEHLKALKDYCKPAPAVNQIEMHPLIYDDRKDIAEYCESNDIVVTAYGSVLSGHQNLLDQAQSIADAHHKTSAQVFLRWALQRRFQIIPKSTHLKWQNENKEVYDFSLSDDEMKMLESFPGNIDAEYWDPVRAQVQVSLLPKPESCPQT